LSAHTSQHLPSDTQASLPTRHTVKERDLPDGLGEAGNHLAGEEGAERVKGAVGLGDGRVDVPITEGLVDDTVNKEWLTYTTCLP